MIFLALVLGAYLMGTLSRSTVAIPPDFKEARSQGALISQNIVDISNEVTKDLVKLSELEKEQKVGEAIALAGQLIERSEQVKNQAQGLSVQLEKMTGALSEIEDPEARRYALEAITDRLALISRLISYSDYLSGLLTNLKNRLAGLPYTNNSQILIDQINAEVTAINNFNRQASQAMESFDKITQ